MIGGIGSLHVKFALDRRLVGNGFSREARFVDLQREGFQQYPVGGDLFSLFQYHDVIDHDVFFCHLVHVAVTDDLYQCVVVHLIQHVEFLVGIPDEPRGYACCQQNGDGNTDGFGYLDNAFREIHGNGYSPGKENGYH